MYCLKPPLSEPPEGSWSCHLCLAVFHRKWKLMTPLEQSSFLFSLKKIFFILSFFGTGFLPFHWLYLAPLFPACTLLRLFSCCFSILLFRMNPIRDDTPIYHHNLGRIGLERLFNSPNLYYSNPLYFIDFCQRSHSSPAGCCLLRGKKPAWNKIDLSCINLDRRSPCVTVMTKPTRSCFSTRLFEFEAYRFNPTQ